MYISEMRGMEQHCMDTACFDAGQKGMSAGCLTHCIISSSKEQVVMLTVLEVSIVYALILLLVFVVLHLVRCCSRGDDWIGLFLRRHTLLGVVLLR